MAKTTINIEIRKPDDTPEEGYIYFKLATADSLGGVEYSDRTPIRVNLNASGIASIQLQPNDDAGWSITGNSYLVEERFSGKAKRQFYMVVPTSGSALNYADLATYGSAPSITAGIDLAAEFAAWVAANNATYSRTANRAVHFSDYTAGRTDLQALYAALDAAEARGKFGQVILPSRVIDVGNGVVMSGYSTTLIGQGGGYASSNPAGTVLKASTQTGPVLDLRGFVKPADFRGRQVFRDFTIEGSNAADASKTKVGIYLSSMHVMEFRNITIQRTGGPGIYALPTTPGDATYFCEFINVTVIQPVGCQTNDVPYFHFRGSNANRFIGCGMYTPAPSDPSGASGCFVLEDDGTTYPAGGNHFVGCWAENLQIPTNGTMIQIKAKMNIIDGWQFWDCYRVSGSTGTSHIRLSDSVFTNHGGNLVTGVIPGDNGGSLVPDVGVEVFQPYNKIEGVKGYKGKNVVIQSGAHHISVRLGGAQSGALDPAVIDNSGVKTNIYVDDYLGTMSSHYGTLTPKNGSGGGDGFTISEVDDPTAGALWFGNAGARIQNSEFANGNTYITGDLFTFRNIALDHSPVVIGPLTGQPSIQLEQTNGSTTPSLRVNTGFIDFGSGKPKILSGSGTPEAAVTAPVGSLFLRSDGGAGTSSYIKESGTGNTGWVAK